MPASNILVVVVDGLRASALGAYGNTTYPTPALDQFAAESILFDGCFSPSSELYAVYRALWNSFHPARWVAANSRPGPRSLPHRLIKVGYRTTLITDEPRLLDVQGAGDFDEGNLFESAHTEDSSTRASDVSQTKIGGLFSAVAERIVNRGGDEPRHLELPRLLWVHSRGMYGPWDAPIEFQASLLDDEATPIISIEPPQIVIGDNDDPDASFRYTMAYAAQVIVLDLAWQVLMDAIAESTESGQTWRIVFMGSRGFPLGENGLIGGADSRLTSAQLHVPWLMRFPDGRGKLVRSRTLVSHLDLLPTLLDAEGIADDEAARADGISVLEIADSGSLADRPLHLSATDSAVAIRTPEWCFRRSRRWVPNDDASTGAHGESGIESGLFVLPDDRWEANDVSKLCPDVIEEFEVLVDTTLRQFSDEVSTGATEEHE